MVSFKLAAIAVAAFSAVNVLAQSEETVKVHILKHFHPGVQ